MIEEVTPTSKESAVFHYKTKDELILEEMNLAMVAIATAQKHLLKTIEMTQEYDIWHCIRQDMRDTEEKLKWAGANIHGNVEFMRRNS